MKLSASGLTKRYDGRIVVKGVDLYLQGGEIVGLLGPNGAGKTTTFYMIVGSVVCDAGDIQLNGETITTLPMFHRARLGIGYLPQETSVFRKLSVEDNLRAILETLPLTQGERAERLKDLLRDLGIAHLAKHKAHTLSGGERRRVEVARALVTSPGFLLLDEPFAGIDPIAVNDLQNLIGELRSKGIGILITDHNVDETLEITDRAYIIHEGGILASGSPREIANSPTVRKIYLGDSFQLKGPRAPS